MIAAAALLRKLIPALRVRVVNVTDLMILGPFRSHPHALSDQDFESLFTPDRQIVINYHSYPIEVKGLLSGRPNLGRVSVEGSVATLYCMGLISNSDEQVPRGRDHDISF